MPHQTRFPTSRLKAGKRWGKVGNFEVPTHLPPYGGLGGGDASRKVGTMRTKNRPNPARIAAARTARDQSARLALRALAEEHDAARDAAERKAAED
jgi:hypothetical protein